MLIVAHGSEPEGSRPRGRARWLFVAHGGGPTVRCLRGRGVPGMAHGAKAPFAGLWWPGDDLGVEVPYGPW